MRSRVASHTSSRKSTACWETNCAARRNICGRSRFCGNNNPTTNSSFVRSFESGILTRFPASRVTIRAPRPFARSTSQSSSTFADPGFRFHKRINFIRSGEIWHVRPNRLASVSSFVITPKNNPLVSTTNYQLSVVWSYATASIAEESSLTRCAIRRIDRRAFMR